MAAERSGLSPVSSASRIGRAPSVGPRPGSFESVRLITPSSFPIRGESAPIPDFRFPPLRPRQLNALRRARIESPKVIPFPEIRPIRGVINFERPRPSLIERQAFALRGRERFVRPRIIRGQARVITSPEVSAIAQTQAEARTRAQTAPESKPQVLNKAALKETQVQRVERKTVPAQELTGQRRRVARVLPISRDHGKNQMRDSALDSTYLKIAQEKGEDNVGAEELIKESGILGKKFKSDIEVKKDGSQVRIADDLRAEPIRRGKLRGIVLEHTAIKVGKAADIATEREIWEVLVPPEDVFAGTLDQRILRRELVFEDSKVATQATGTPLQEVWEEDRSKVETETNGTNNLVLLPNLNLLAPTELMLGTLDIGVHNNIVGITEREELFKAA